MTRERRKRKWSPALRRQGWLLWGVLLIAVILASAALLLGRQRASAEPPEAGKVLAVQASMPFQILIPAYMPEAFDRAGAEIQANLAGPGGEPMVEVAYYDGWRASLFIRQWVPIHPDAEILGKSRPIQTKWGQGWLLAPQNGNVLAIWVDVGPLRVAIMTHYVDVVSQEQLLYMANTLGPASNQQVFSFIVEKPQIKDVPPPRPVEAKLNAQGVQELTLVITPGGYSPLRFSVRKGIPVKLTFRRLGQVGCGNVLVCPVGPDSVTVMLSSESDKRLLEFTPQQTGEFIFRCGHDMYRGMMVVQE